MKRFFALLVLCFFVAGFAGTSGAQEIFPGMLYLEIEKTQDFGYDGADSLANISEGEAVYISLYGKEVDSLIGWNFRIEFDGAAFNFIEFDAILGLDEASPLGGDIGISQLTDGSIGIIDTVDLASVIAGDAVPYNMPADSFVFLGRVLFQAQAGVASQGPYHFISINSGDMGYVRRPTSGFNEVVYPVGDNVHNAAIGAAGTVDVDEGPLTVKSYSLGQNYPNPFNPTTNIPFSLRSSGRVKLTVYNILGQEVGVLINGTMSAGEHVHAFNANGLASGIYFYRLEADGYSSMKKLVILK
ncbi:T9SS type A sorting domain-containing protein [candidate division KSB1 bacterium]